MPPTIGEPSTAARAPWRLPAEPGPPAVAADEYRLGLLEVRAASVVGPGHRCDEPASPRQDAYRIGRDATGRHLIVAVADGVSDSRRADVGASVATRFAVDALRAHLDAGATVHDLRGVPVFESVAGHIVAAARHQGADPQEYCTGLLTAVVPAFPSRRGGRRDAWFASVADVTAWGLLPGSWLPLAGDVKEPGDTGELANVLPFTPHRTRDVVVDLPPWAVVAIVTDGVTDGWAQVPGALEWFAERWSRPSPLGSFLLDVSYEARGQQDDRTAVTIWCGGQAATR